MAVYHLCEQPVFSPAWNRTVSLTASNCLSQVTGFGREWHHPASLSLGHCL